MRRETGFYWVLYDNAKLARREDAEWIVAEYHSFDKYDPYWRLPGFEDEFYETEPQFIEIDERRIVRDVLR